MSDGDRDNSKGADSVTTVTACCAIQLVSSVMNEVFGDTLTKVVSDNKELTILITNAFDAKMV